MNAGVDFFVCRGRILLSGFQRICWSGWIECSMYLDIRQNEIASGAAAEIFSLNSRAAVQDTSAQAFSEDEVKNGVFEEQSSASALRFFALFAGDFLNPFLFNLV